MISSFSRQEWESAGPDRLSDELERGRIVHFPECPIELAEAADLDFLRRELPLHISAKNISYHHERGRVSGIGGGPEVHERAHRVLTTHSARVQQFLKRVMPNLTKGWKPGTTSVRPLQERGRHLSAHASNELIHVDAAAYGATHGDRILRFFVNINPSEDRVWLTRGAFPDLVRKYGEAAGVTPPRRLGEGLLDRFWTGLVYGVAFFGMPSVRLADTSPYDRVMRRFHNYMKDTPGFQESPDGRLEFHFKPGEAWMVFTDMVSHACIEGRHALVDTFIIPLENCRLREMTPYHILEGGVTISTR